MEDRMTTGVGRSISLRPWEQKLFDPGDTGTYETVQENNPALDAHWGMEKTYDYYLNVHNRNSFDGRGEMMLCSFALEAGPMHSGPTTV